MHNGPGQNGGVVHALQPGSPKVGVWEVDAADVTALHAGRIFVNVHSDVYASGEISGYLTFSSVPAEDSAWGRAWQPH